jgi:hypothetical protein
MKKALSTCDLDSMSELPAMLRAEVLRLMAVCEEIDAAPKVAAGIREAVARHGLPMGTIKRKFYAWKRLGWHGLVDRRAAAGNKAAMDVGDIYKGYCERNQRGSREAWRQMMVDFRSGKYFEDVGTWREVWAREHADKATPFNCPADYVPKGWTYANLQKTAGLTAYESRASRIGRGAARDLLPSVYSSRAGLAVGSMYMFDDMWWDLKVNFPGNARAQRVIELACVDVASACRCAWGAKPRREDLDTGKMRNLNECDMRQLLAHMLINIGYHPEGCRMVVEHGTAAASADLDALIVRLTGGAVTFERSGIISDPIHKGLWCGQPRGNYKRKAALESQHSLAHTVGAALKGQIGRNRDNAPEQMYGLEQYNTQLVKAAAALPVERAKLLMMPLLDFNQAVAAMGDLYRAMNLRRWHDLEGWEESGYVATQFRLSPQSQDWMPMERILDVPGQQYDLLYNAIQAMPEQLCRTVKLSPQEVFDEGCKALVRLPKSCMPQILGERLGDIKEVGNDGLITYRNQEFGPGEFRYLATRVTDAHGFNVPLAPGLKVCIHINPFNLDECFVSHAESGAYIGLAARWQTVCKTNVHALEQMAGKQAHIEAELRAPIARRGAQVIKERIEMHQNNSAVFAGEAISDSERAELDRVQQATGKLSDIFGEDESDLEAVEVPRRTRGSLSDIWSNEQTQENENG